MYRSWPIKYVQDKSNKDATSCDSPRRVRLSRENPVKIKFKQAYVSWDGFEMSA